MILIQAQDYGVSEGSILGLIFFTIYMAPVGDLISKYGLQYHIYADDTQLYIAISPLDKEECAKAKCNMEKCICVNNDFLVENGMKLNHGKIYFLIMGIANKLKNVRLKL